MSGSNRPTLSIYLLPHTWLRTQLFRWTSHFKLLTASPFIGRLSLRTAAARYGGPDLDAGRFRSFIRGLPLIQDDGLWRRDFAPRGFPGARRAARRSIQKEHSAYSTQQSAKTRATAWSGRTTIYQIHSRLAKHLSPQPRAAAAP